MKTQINYLKAMLATIIIVLTAITNNIAQVVKVKLGKDSTNVERSTSAKNDTTRFSVGNSKVLIISPKEDKDSLSKNDTSKHSKKHHHFEIYWSGIGLGINGYLNANNEIKVPAGYDFMELNYPKSINVSFNFAEQKIPICRKHVNIITGLGLDIRNYRFEKNYKLMPDSNYITAVYDSAFSYERNKLLVSYLNVPLLLQFDTKPLGKDKETLHLSAGVVGSIKIGSHTKQVYNVDGTKFKPKTKDDFNLNPFGYSAMARIGYGNLDLWASYSLSTLFKKNEGPQLYPFTIGITLIGM